MAAQRKQAPPLVAYTCMGLTCLCVPDPADCPQEAASWWWWLASRGGSAGSLCPCWLPAGSSLLVSDELFDCIFKISIGVKVRRSKSRIIFPLTGYVTLKRKSLNLCMPCFLLLSVEFNNPIPHDIIIFEDKHYFSEVFWNYVWWLTNNYNITWYGLQYRYGKYLYTL